MKRSFIILLAALLFLSLAACGLPPLPPPPSLSPFPDAAQPLGTGEEAPAAAELTLEVLLCRRSDETERAFLAPGPDGMSFVERFEAGHPGVRLKLELLPPEELETLLASRVAAGGAPDILSLFDPSALEAEGLLLPAEDFCPPALCGDFFPALAAPSGPDGALVSLPVLADAELLLCSGELLAEAGAAIPATWAELEESCRLIREFYGGAVCPLGVDMTEEGAASCFACYARGSGGDLVGPEGAWALNSDENKAGLAFALSLVDRGFTNPNPAVEGQQELLDMFAAGGLAMLPARCSACAPLLKAGAELPVLAPLPAAEAAPGRTSVTVERLVILRDDGAPDQDARREAIAAFLSAFYDPAHYAARAAAEGLLPASRAAAAALPESCPLRELCPQLLESCRPLPVGAPGWDAVSEGLYAVLQLSLIGGDYGAALDLLQASVTELT